MRLSKVPPNTDRAWVKQLPDHGIAEILDTMHDCLGGALRQALQNEYWDRHATPLVAWPQDGKQVTPQGLTFTFYCGFHERLEAFCKRKKTDITEAIWDDWKHEQQFGPDDPTHQPTRTLTTDQSWADLECSCGWRSDRAGEHPKRWRSSATWWWPQTLVEGRMSCYVVCPWRSARLSTLADPRHAPSKFEGDFLESCICGWGYYSASREPTLIPV